MLRFKDAPKTDLTAPKLIRVKPGPPLEVMLLNEKYVGLDTHYWGGHTIACPGEDTCKACGDGLIPVFSAFIFCQLWDGGRVALIALTPVMCANLLLGSSNPGNLLGMKVRFRRKTKAVNSGVVTTLHGFAQYCDAQSMERLIMRVRIIFKDYVIEDKGPSLDPSSQGQN